VLLLIDLDNTPYRPTRVADDCAAAIAAIVRA
jgi:hypothetical protein